uniref:Apple domain-containing protein n=1 Tax=Clytia hemisphaerica TaxID=252671 RepID=A0A7M5X1G6_9CNID
MIITNFILLYLKLNLVFASDQFFTITKQDKQLRGFHLYTRRNRKEVECIYDCTHEPRCQSINHHTEQRICQLNKEASQLLKDEKLVDAVGWRYFEKSEKPEALVRPVTFKKEFEYNEGRPISIAYAEGQITKINIIHNFINQK